MYLIFLFKFICCMPIYLKKGEKITLIKRSKNDNFIMSNRPVNPLIIDDENDLYGENDVNNGNNIDGVNRLDGGNSDNRLDGGNSDNRIDGGNSENGLNGLNRLDGGNAGNRLDGGNSGNRLDGVDVVNNIDGPNVENDVDLVNVVNNLANVNRINNVDFMNDVNSENDADSAKDADVFVRDHENHAFVNGYDDETTNNVDDNFTNSVVDDDVVEKVQNEKTWKNKLIKFYKKNIWFINLQLTLFAIIIVIKLYRYGIHVKIARMIVWIFVKLFKKRSEIHVIHDYEVEKQRKCKRVTAKNFKEFKAYVEKKCKNSQ